METYHTVHLQNRLLLIHPDHRLTNLVDTGNRIQGSGKPNKRKALSNSIKQYSACISHA